MSVRLAVPDLAAGSPARAARTTKSGAVAVLVAVIVVDQVVKWWAWRHAPEAQINPGGDVFVNAVVGQWFADPVSGALLDVLDFGILSVVFGVLLRDRVPVFVRLTGVLAVAGWLSNVADRLGMHYVTAPGSLRGAVDFLPWGDVCYNVADAFIAGGTVFAVPALIFWAFRGTATARPGKRGSPARFSARGWLAVAACALCLTVTAGFGVVHSGEAVEPERLSVAAG